MGLLCYIGALVRKTHHSFLSFFILFLASFANVPAFAAWVWSPEAGKFVNPDEMVQETPQKQYDYAQEFYKKKDLKEAANQFRLLLKKYPGSQVAPESQYRLGTIYEEMGDYYRAFRAYRDLLTRYPQSDRVAEAVEREYRIGNFFLSGRKGKVMGLAILPSGPRAIEVFKHLVEAAPYSEYGDKAQFQLGVAYKKTNQFEESIQAFQDLIDHYPQSSLLPQARYQLADTAYLQSVVATRDQRIMDRASEEIGKFLTRYPDSSVSDKAARLRQEIDEKNAEKNYRIGLFYEKENYLDSAFIYYRDVAARYPHTQWGKKAAERLRILERPTEFLKAQEAGVAVQKQKLLSELQTISGTNPARKKEIDWELKRTEKQEKEIQKAKPETIKRRLAAVELKEKALKDKWKALRMKKKHFAKNPSEDLALAFKRWEESLKQEQSDLEREKLQVKEWRRNLGVKTEPFYTEWVPFGKEAPSPLEQVQVMEAKRFRELVSRKTDLFQEKEKLYQEYEKLVAVRAPQAHPEPAYQARREKLQTLALEMEELQKELREKQFAFEQHYGPAYYTTVPLQSVGPAAELPVPLERSSRKEWHRKSLEALQGLESQWQKKIAEQQKGVETVSQAFDNELARAEEKRLTANIQEAGTDAATLRRTIKQLEREIRGRYNEIQDRNEKKNELLEELERTLRREREAKGGPLTQTERTLTAPARGIFDLGKAFVFGLPERDVTLTRQATQTVPDAATREKIRGLKEEIELESILIDTRNREIERLKRELEALRARASLEKVPPGRSLLVKFPYVFIREAVVSANRLVPKKERHEKLIGQLNKETAKLERLKRELAEIEALLQKKRTQAAGPAPASQTPVQAPLQSPAQPLPDAKILRNEIHTLGKRLETLQTNYGLEHKLMESDRWKRISVTSDQAGSGRLRKVEKKLARLIESERKIHDEEGRLLIKKKELVQKFLANPSSEAVAKKLRLEQDEIDTELNEIANRKLALSEELKRLRPQTVPSS